MTVDPSAWGSGLSSTSGVSARTQRNLACRTMERRARHGTESSNDSITAKWARGTWQARYLLTRLPAHRAG